MLQLDLTEELPEEMPVDVFTTENTDLWQASNTSEMLTTLIQHAVSRIQCFVHANENVIYFKIISFRS